MAAACRKTAQYLFAPTLLLLLLPAAVCGLESVTLVCDLNCDGAVDGLDIDPFVLALGSTLPDCPEYYAQHPDCNVMTADCNADGALDVVAGQLGILRGAGDGTLALGQRLDFFGQHGFLSDRDGDGATICGGDCDDNNPQRSPYLDEVCDYIDNDCNG